MLLHIQLACSAFLLQSVITGCSKVNGKNQNTFSVLGVAKNIGLISLK